jgi:hypothetical protein
MTPQEVNEFVALLEGDYPMTFSRPSFQQLWLWYEDLETYEVATALKARYHWVRWHRETPPELAEIVRECKEVEHEAARWQSPADALPRERSADDATLLQRMAPLALRYLGPWQDAAGNVHPRLTDAELAACCWQWSVEYANRPALAGAFEVMAKKFIMMAEAEDAPAGHTSLTRPERGVANGRPRAG